VDPLDQAELPGREPLDDAQLYRRRERVLLVVASLFVAGAAMLPILGATKAFGASWIFLRAGYEPPLRALVPAGALALPFALVALNLVGELFGKSRARVLLVAMLLVWVGELGLLWVMDHLADYDRETTTLFFPALALVTGAFVTCLLQIELFAAISVRWLRHLLAPLFAIAAGWAVFGLIAKYTALPGMPAAERVAGLALGAGGYTWLGVVACSIPAMIISRPLAIYVRVVLRRRRPRYEDEYADEPAFVR
jgi:uncharacterized PurR-regulated membrane protein YhhQ (DUF165 family)